MNNKISVIIPCYNCAQTIHICLQSVFKSDYPDYEVIVVDDNSSDDTKLIVAQFPCRLIKLSEHKGAGYARNVGAHAAGGDILFFTDADCVLQVDTLSTVTRAMTGTGENVVIGGTYTQHAFDRNFFSRFQSLFIHYAETKHLNKPDYIATHALVMRASLFRQHEGFNNREFPILEDVEYSHRLKRNGVQLKMFPELQVQHIFNFSFLRSMKNAVRKTRFWTTYLLNNRGLLTDSGTASHELKFNTMAFTLEISLVLIFIITGHIGAILLFITVLLINIAVNFRFLKSISRTQSKLFTLAASGYYFMVYPIAVTSGSLLGISSYLKLRYKAKEFA